MNKRREDCKNKRKYKTLTEAVASVKQLERKRGYVRYYLKTYKCPYGDHYHIFRDKSIFPYEGKIPTLSELGA